jgi:glutamyl/glutaminyl-tRNA synthetase
MKTRFAPTPSGFLHLGNVYSFALTAKLARETGARTLLRIDDLDKNRVNPAYVQDIFDTLRFLDLPWDGGPSNYTEYETTYAQEHRMPLYKKALERLKTEVFACTCSRSQVQRESGEAVYPGTCRNKGIPLDAEGVSWRLKTETPRMLTVKGLKDEQRLSLPSSMVDFVVRKKDGFPAYQLTSLIDDLYFGIDLIVRGEDLWPSTLAQLYLAQVLGEKAFADVTFCHHPLLTEPGGGKMSKSGGATSIQYLRREGKTAADIYALLPP